MKKHPTAYVNCNIYYDKIKDENLIAQIFSVSVSPKFDVVKEGEWDKICLNDFEIRDISIKTIIE